MSLPHGEWCDECGREDTLLYRHDDRLLCPNCRPPELEV